MRWILCGTAALMLAGLADMRPAAAQEYPWCAYYTRGDVANCGFRSFAQCRATVVGIGGYCQQNPRYFAQRRSYRDTPRRTQRPVQRERRIRR